MKRFGAWLAARWLALDLELRDVEFYGGLVLIGMAPGRWMIVGGILVAHAWLTPMLNGLTTRRA
jgi:hypothetical protein